MAAHAVPAASSAVPLGEDQAAVLAAVQSGRNVFMTGVAGTGKSFTIEKVVEWLKSSGKCVAVTAPTGVAALNINGETLHSMAGCGVPALAKDFGKCWGQIGRQKWRSLHFLIVDEIGMVDAEYLDWLDATVREIRSTPHLPFGGVQILCCGDFCQLSPVPGTQMSLTTALPDDYNEVPMGVTELSALCFQTAFWRDADFVCVRLGKVWRQSDS